MIDDGQGPGKQAEPSACRTVIEWAALTHKAAIVALAIVALWRYLTS